MVEGTKMYMVLDTLGNPIMRSGDEANPYMFHNLIDACVFANAEKKNLNATFVIEIIKLGRVWSDVTTNPTKIKGVR